MATSHYLPANFCSPRHHTIILDGGDLVFGPDGAFYIADGGAGTVWRIAPILGELDHIEITGPDEVAENSQAQYVATAYYSGGTVIDVTSSAEWAAGPNTYGNIDENGMLTTQHIHDLQENITIYAQYTAGEVTAAGQKDVSIFSVCPSGSALKFDGQNDYVDLGDFDGIVGSNPFTIAAWVNPIHVGGKNMGIITKADGGQSDDVQFLIRINQQGKFEGMFSNGSIFGNSIITEQTVPINYWSFLVFTWDGSTAAESMKLFIDGELKRTRQSSVSSIQNIDFPAFIGAFSNSGSPLNPFDGLIDELRIYNRTLSAEEIRMLMHIRPDTGEPNLVGYWDFNEGQGQLAHDLSDSNNHGYLGTDPCGIDSSDPCWVDSDAPVGICTLEGIVKRDLSNVLDTKADILDELAGAMAEEQIVLDMLNTHFKNRDFGDADRQDVVRAKQRIHTAIQHEIQAETDVYKSIGDLEDALSALDCEVTPHGPPEFSGPDSAIRADLNGDRVVDFRDFVILSNYWLEFYEIE